MLYLYISWCGSIPSQLDVMIGRLKAANRVWNTPSCCLYSLISIDQCIYIWNIHRGHCLWPPHRTYYPSGGLPTELTTHLVASPHNLLPVWWAPHRTYYPSDGLTTELIAHQVASPTELITHQVASPQNLLPIWWPPPQNLFPSGGLPT